MQLMENIYTFRALLIFCTGNTFEITPFADKINFIWKKSFTTGSNTFEVL